ncbi:uncharacterized protein LOC123564516 [Mercenaria mercenaria]|uniref:uncharacterized protein LOC123564516 n=1 Tax=Mercenaria mercenaria TaxID=6596 RepID=UPI00234E63BC|nr:uncharacterized protein LOC123564516 [Mercenaria mercenaria]
MSVLVPSHGCAHSHKLSDTMGTSSYSAINSDPDIGYSSHRHNSKRKHKHKKQKKHRHHKNGSKSSEVKSVDKRRNTEEAGLNKISKSKSDDYRSSGDYLNKGRDFLVPIEDMPDFSWLTKEFKFSDITNTFDSESAVTEISAPEPGLSQRELTSANLPGVYDPAKYKQDERSTIEQEIQEKYAEIDVLLGKLNAKRQRSKRRRKYHLRKYDSLCSGESGQWTSSYVNICPIKRNKRCAQPIRDALLVRSAMRKTWKGLLGSCCGKGCWASWKWVSLRCVISDYE